MKHFGSTLYKIIDDKRLKKKDIAEKAGLDPSHLSQLMNKEYFNPKLLERICFAIGISPGIMFDDWPDGKYTIREINNSTIIGDATVNVGDNSENLKELLKEKERIIEEKERFIKLLLRQNGMSEIIDGI